jgi:hypothetical protein
LECGGKVLRDAAFHGSSGTQRQQMFHPEPKRRRGGPCRRTPKRRCQQPCKHRREASNSAGFCSGNPFACARQS